MDLAPLTVGIDLGTTNSLCAVFESGAPRLIPNSHGGVLTPSVVAVLKSGEILVGDAARELRLTDPDRTCSMFKRWMGQGRKVELGGKEFSAAQLSSLVLRSLVADVKADLGREPTNAVITVPAYFNEHQRRDTRLAGELAGLKVERVVNEPTAAALSHGYHNSSGISNLLVFDLGGGTFDVTVMEVFEDTLEILSSAGESHLGGEDFTDKILSWAIGEMGLVFEHAEVQQPFLVSRLRSEAERAKRLFGTEDRATLRIPDEQGDIANAGKTLELGAAHFEELCEPLIARLRKPVDRAMRGAGLSWDQIDDVLMVGGATRMPIVRRFVTDLLGRAPKAQVDPDLVVAYGAAVQVALIADNKAVGDLGIEVTKDLGRREVEGYYLPIIHRNTTIPVSCEEVVYTRRPNQTNVTVAIFQGEARRVGDNIKLGELDVSGIPPGPAGQEIAVRFTYDLNGLVEVEAYLPSTGAKFHTVLTQGVNGLDKRAVKAALKEMQKLKFYPRDDLDNQRLLNFAEGVVKELDGEMREALEAGLDVYETVLYSGDREGFAMVREQLIQQLRELGFPFPTRTEGDSGRD
ncbi:UNVERIFIED_CONTAM: hypothetical protein GTU68_063080 [Idotea baltica]|nr:hypothetical protein [Idotea baltica]